jgi:hypothetical protein
VREVTVVGGGANARTCAEVLEGNGFQVRHAFELEAGDRSPLILGDAPGAFTIARQALEAGRHLLIASPASFPTNRLSFLYDDRQRSQALIVWNARRFHSGYRFVNSLTEADATWRLRYLRFETLITEPTSMALGRSRTLEAVSLLLSLTPDLPLEASCFEEPNPVRNGPDLITVRVAFRDVDAFIQIGLGEAVDRRETVLAADHRKCYVDELNPSMPVRLVEDGSRPYAGSQARWLSMSSYTPEEMARQQCLAFIDATENPALAQTEAVLWRRSIAVLQALERSLQAEGASLKINLQEDQEPRFRLILGNLASPPSVA